ncbi:hypothetical protein K1719_005524 [Acacia pycnantha]|nr:hypothetical protein K1719_005524 [Acacia pycnantha]
MYCTIEEYLKVSSAHKGVACGETEMQHALVESEILNEKMRNKVPFLEASFTLRNTTRVVRAQNSIYGRIATRTISGQPVLERRHSKKQLPMVWDGPILMNQPTFSILTYFVTYIFASDAAAPPMPSTRVHWFERILKKISRRNLRKFASKKSFSGSRSREAIGLGDRNTAYYHAKAVKRRHRNIIFSLKDDAGMWGLFPKLDSNVIANLGRDVTIEEVHDALFGMKPMKSPGVDGLPALFFQHQWGPSVYKFVQSVFRGEGLEPELNRTLIALIPKVARPERFKEFRPISLCSVLYKIITKVERGLVATHIQPGLASIHPSLVLPSSSYGECPTLSLILIGNQSSCLVRLFFIPLSNLRAVPIPLVMDLLQDSGSIADFSKKAFINLPMASKIVLIACSCPWQGVIVP